MGWNSHLERRERDELSEIKLGSPCAHSRIESRNRSISRTLEALEGRELMSAVPFDTTFLAEPLLYGSRMATTGDIDGDQIVDLLVVESAKDTVSWYRNETTAGAERPTISTAPRLVGSTGDEDVQQITTLDVNGDGRLDIVVGMMSFIGWFRQLEHGRFAPIERLYDAGGTGSFFSTLVVSDVNLDGRTDLVAADADKIHVLLKNAEGLEPSQTVPTSSMITSLVATDLDGDHDVDLAVTHPFDFSKGISIYRNDAGRFTEVASFPVERSIERLLGLDPDGDGDQDLLAVSGFDWTSLRNDGDWSFTRMELQTPTIPTVQQWTAGDLNDDGRDEVILLDGIHVLSVSISEGTAAIQYSVGYRAVSYRAWWDDLNADGKTDLILHESSKFSIDWISNPSKLSVPESILGGGWSSIDSQLVVADLDRDGDSDLLAREAFSGLMWSLENVGQGAFSQPQSFKLSDLGTVLAAADVDGDGDDDLLGQGRRGGSFLGELVWAANEAEQPFTKLQTVFTDFLLLSQVEVADVDMNGTLDLVVSYAARTGGARIVAVPATSPGVFGAPIQWIQFPDIPQRFELVDWNEDGRLDVMTTDGLVIRWSRQSGSLQFDPWIVVADDWAALSFDLGDMDGDGDLDLVRDYPRFMIDPPADLADRIAVFRNEGRGNLVRVNLFPRAELGYGFWADVNGDTKEDLVFQGDQIRWYPSLGAAGMDQNLQTIVSPRDFITDLMAADLDRDSDLDLIASTAGGLVYVQRNQLNAAELRGDLNRDGRVNVTDIDELASWRRASRWLAQADLQLDGQIDGADRDLLVTELVDTVYGDVNDDRVFDSADLVSLFASGQYDQPSGVASWKTGDFDGDGRFDSFDLILALQSGAYQE